MCRPLGILRNVVERAGDTISYAHDDLIFVEHTVYLLQFDDVNTNNIKLYFNTDCDKSAIGQIESILKKEAKKDKLTISNSGFFTLEEKEGSEELNLRFSI